MGIFEPYRAVGYITAGVPFSVQRLGTETFVTVSIGKAWQVYNCAKLTLALAGPQLPKNIRALASFKDYTFAAYGTEIGVYKRVELVATWSKHKAKINSLLLFGDCVLSSDVKGNIYIWAFKGASLNLEPISHIKLETKFTPTCLAHPDTYLNKVIIGSEEGRLQLWNVSSKKMLYEFKGWGSAVTCLVSSPALDIVAVGCADGSIHLHNLRYDEEVVSFSHSIKGAVTSLSFRTDGEAVLASGGSSGVISIWNLEKRRVQCVIKEAHDSNIVSLHFFANEPVLMSSASDNSIKMWIFDNSDGEARLLRFRRGHSAPPLCIKFYGNGRHILSAGQDRAFRLFSVAKDSQSRELSQRHITKRAKRVCVKEEEIKLKPVIAFDCAEIRARDWCNVVTCHMDTPCAYVWRLQNFVLGEHILTPSIQSPVKACVISACGNFAIIGTVGGWVERFNLQSGRSRGSFLDKTGDVQCAHTGEVVGIASDATNGSVITAAFQGDIKIWNFKTLELKSRFDVGRAVTKIVFHRANGLLATVCSDSTIRVYDTLTSRLVRNFSGHTDRITDVTFSEDGKWIISSSMDSTVRVWDVILAKQIDAMRVDVAVTGVTLSANMDLLGTAHVDQNGVYLWANQAMFMGTTSNYANGGEIRNVEMPRVSSKEESYEEENNNNESIINQRENKKESKFTLLDRQIPNLVTLSLLPRSQWQNLTNIDIIKARNKPIEPPKKPEMAPFFLPSVPSLSGDITFNAITNTSEEKDNDPKLNFKKIDLSSHFVRVLESCTVTKDFSVFTDYLKELSPSNLDLEFRMLQIVDEEEEENLEEKPEFLTISLLLDYFVHELSARNNFEFVQALIKLFLKIHGETVRKHLILQEKVKKLLEFQSLVWQRIDKMFQNARCMVTFLSNSQF